MNIRHIPKYFILVLILLSACGGPSTVAPTEVPIETGAPTEAATEPATEAVSEPPPTEEPIADINSPPKG